MPETKACFPQSCRISPMASMVSSAEDDVSKNTAIIVASPFMNTSRSLLGRISFGTERSAKLSYQMALSTWSICSIS